MSEKEFSKNGNIPHIPDEQADEAELLPPENDDAEGHQAELHMAEAEVSPPRNDAEDGHEAELHPPEAELLPPGNGDGARESEGHEAKLNPIEVKSSAPKNYGASRTLRPPAGYHDIEAILSRLRDHDARRAAEHESASDTVEAESSPRKSYGAGRAQRQKAGLSLAEVILSRSRNDDAAETDDHEVNQPIETESRESNQSPLEGAVGGVKEDCNCNDFSFLPCEGSRIQSGKEDIFRKFFSDEYDQAKAPILGRQRHSAQIQRIRHRHVSEDSKLSDPNPLGCLQDAGTSSGAVLNQAGAIIGKYIPKEEIPEYARYGTEFGQSLPLVQTNEGSERSIGSMSTAPIGEIYGGTFSVISDISCGSLEFAQRTSFPSFSSRQSTAASDNLDKSQSDSNSSEGDKDQLRMDTDKNIAHGNPVRQRKLGTVANQEQIRSKSALAGLLEFAGVSQDGELPQRKLSKDESVRSEPLPQRKLSSGSSVKSSDQMSVEDEANYKELSHSIESDSDMPMPDIGKAVDSLEENLVSLTISEVESATVVQNVASEQNESSESVGKDHATAESSSTEIGGTHEQTEANESSEQDPVTATNSSTESAACRQP